MPEVIPKVGPVRVPEFFGTEAQDVMSPRQWVARVADCKTISEWEDRTAIRYAKMALRGTAQMWIASVEDRGELPNTWAAFTTLFLARFQRTPTLAQRSQLMDTLKQKKGEDCRAFHDRCYQVLKTLYDDWPSHTNQNAGLPDALRGAEHEAANTAAKKFALEYQFTTTFVAGLVQSIRQEVVAKKSKNLG